MIAPLRAQETLERARTIMDSGRGAALPELLEIIETLSLNICEVSISELGELIEKDAVVLAKVVAVANTLFHNPRIVPIATLSQAIHQLGYNRIRTLAVSLMLLDHAGGSHPPERREAAALALCAGLLAQAAAQELGTHDPELVFACAALRNFGPVMFAAVSPEHTRAAVQRIPQSGPALAYRALFGLTPLEFTRKILSAARLPAEVLVALRDGEPESLNGIATTFEGRLLGLADYGSRLAQLTLAPCRTSDGFVGQARTLGRRFARLVPGAPDLAGPVLARADDRLRQFTTGHGFAAMPTKSLTRIGWRAQLYSTDPVTAEAAPTDSTPPLPPPAPDDPLPADPAAPDDASAPEPIEPLATELAAAAPTDPLLAALARVRDLFAARDCWLFRAAPGEKHLRLVRSLDPRAIAAAAEARVDPAERSVFGVCLQRREIVVMHDATQSPHVPRWFRQHLEAPGAFLLVPLPASAGPSELLLVGWPAPRRLAVTPAQVAQAREALAPAARAAA